MTMLPDQNQRTSTHLCLRQQPHFLFDGRWPSWHLLGIHNNRHCERLYLSQHRRDGFDESYSRGPVSLGVGVLPTLVPEVPQLYYRYYLVCLPCRIFAPFVY